MTMPRTATASEQVRLLAMLRLDDGWSRQDVCEFFGVSTRSLNRWCRNRRDGGEAGLLTRPRSGRPPKLDDQQAQQVLACLGRSARDFGFATERWTAPRVAAVVEQRVSACGSTRGTSTTGSAAAGSRRRCRSAGRANATSA